MNASEGIDPEVIEGMVSLGMPLGEVGPPPDLELLETMRAQPSPIPFDPVPAPGVRRDEMAIAGLDGAPDVPIRIFRRTKAVAGVPGVVWIHGGGYILGSYDLDATFLDGLVAKTGCVAVSVDYRLAPETPYPGALDDCFTGLEFLHANASELGVDRSRLAVGGFSAGAGLAAACALRARDQGIQLIHQHLVYPMLDDRQVTPSSQWDMLAIWSRELNAFAWQCYLGDLYGTDAVPGLAAPARAHELEGLPPAYMHVGTLDGFLHEDVEYAARLIAAGVPTELHVLPSLPHGFDVLAPDAAATRTATGLSDAALVRVLSSEDT